MQNIDTIDTNVSNISLNTPTNLLVGNKNINNGSSNRKNSNKINGNHLLNFSFIPPIEEPRLIHRTSSNIKKRTVVPFNKQAFLSSTYRFLLDKRLENLPSIQKALTNADEFIDWRLISVVQYPVSNHDEFCCSICLDRPIAPVITKCGHLFCSECIMHYFSFCKDINHCKCPLCFEYIKSNDLKVLEPVSINKTIAASDDVDLILFKRNLHNITPEFAKSSETNANISNFLRYQFVPDLVISDSFCRERIVITESLPFSDHIHSMPYLNKALDLFLELENDLSCAIVQAMSSFNDISTSLLLKSESEFLSKNESYSAHNNEYVYYYQSCDGQFVFLHSINFKCLIEQFGSPDNFPQNIRAKCLEVESYSQTLESRKKMKFLNHLPLSANFYVAEFDLRNIICRETYLKFKGEISKRAMTREILEKKRIAEDKKLERIDQNRIKNNKLNLRGAPVFLVEDKKDIEMPPLPKVADFQPTAAPQLAGNGWNKLVDRGLGNSETWEALPTRESRTNAKKCIPTWQILGNSKETKESEIKEEPVPEFKPVKLKGGKTLLFSNSGGRR